jgi:hypothetical protein
MTLEDDSLILLRNLIDDVDEDNYEFSDTRLLSLLYVAASYVNIDVVGGYSISLCNQTITPEIDSNFVNLVALKAACMLLRSQQTSFARSGDFKVVDGPAQVDVKNLSGNMKISADSVCDQYQRLRLSVIMGAAVGGLCISTPNSNSFG